MDDFSGILPSEFSLRSQGKGLSMASRSAYGNNPKSSNPGAAFDDILGGGMTGQMKRTGKSSDDSFNFDWSGTGEKSSSAPVYDKPLYDEDIYGVTGIKTSSSVNYVDDFSSISLPPNEGGAFDILGNFGNRNSESISTRNQRFGEDKNAVMDFDDLVHGFSRGSVSDRHTTDIGHQHQKSSVPVAKSTSNTMEEPFVVLDSPSGTSSDPLDRFRNLSTTENMKVHNSSRRGTVFDDVNPLEDLGKAMPEKSCQGNATNVNSGSRESGTENSFDKELGKNAYVRSPENLPQQRMSPRQRVSIDNNLDSRQSFFGMPTASSDPYNSVGPASPSYVGHMSPDFEESLESSDDVWLTVSEIPLFTEPTSAPPPSRPPPPKPVHILKEDFSRDSKSSRRKANDFSVFSNSPLYVETFRPPPTTMEREISVSVIDELEEFAMGRDQYVVEDRDSVSVEELETNSAAAAMKDAVDRATAEFRHAKEVRVKENVKVSKSKEPGSFERDEKYEHDAQGKAIREKQERLEHERRQREREEEREQKKIEMERAREIERERLIARQAVERATREARERAAAEARLKAERLAVGKANAEARERAERIAVQRAQAEARERAALEAKERAEKAASEARERANAEMREKEGRARAFVSKAETEARIRAERAAVERAAAEARERAASSARASHQKKEDDFESFFTMGARPSSAPRPRASSESGFDTQSQNRQGSEAVKRTSTDASSSIKKTSSSLNIVDDLTSIFGAARSSGDFQDVEGETEDRRQARLERHQRTQERASKALADKNERDLQMQRDQAERNRISETLDIEIKRWAAGKDGNLRALLSTLQYVLWPECGWQAVSLTDLITGASVKKVYRKATLCIHPDKVQQKGANIQQKYIAEKVFDLLKEAWNKFNSEELF